MESAAWLNASFTMRLTLIEAKQKRPPLDVFEQALKNATPTLEVKPRRVGGSTYQVPWKFAGIVEMHWRCAG